MYRLQLLSVLILLSAIDVSASVDTAARIENLAGECAANTGSRYEITIEEAYPEDPAEARDWIIVDVRSLEERKVSIIPGSLPRKDFEALREELRARSILVYCTVGCRSGDYVQKLINQGFEAYNLHGGILAWAFSGRELVDDEGRPTKKAHVFGKRWAVLPPPFENVLSDP